jgi:hypothetical protein
LEWGPWLAVCVLIVHVHRARPPSMDLLEVLGLSRPVADCAVCFELYFDGTEGKPTTPMCAAAS